MAEYGHGAADGRDQIPHGGEAVDESDPRDGQGIARPRRRNTRSSRYRLRGWLETGDGGRHGK